MGSIIGVVVGAAVFFRAFGGYNAKDGRWYCYKESPTDYRSQHRKKEGGE